MSSLGDAAEALATLQDLGSITLAGRDLRADVRGRVTGTSISRSIAEVPKFSVTFNDGQRQVARSGIFGHGITCHVGPYQYSALSMSKSGDDLTIEFEDNVIARLQVLNAPLKVAAGKMTHVEFVKSLVRPIKWLKFRTVDNPGKYKVETSKTPLFRGSPATSKKKAKREGTWAAITRIGAERGWRCFIRGVDELWYVPDAYLLNDSVMYTMSETDPWVMDIDYEINIRKKVATLSVSVLAAQYAIPAGCCVLVEDTGPSYGKWIVQDITREPISNPVATLTLIHPQPILPEPEPESKSTGGGGSGTAAISSNKATAVAQYAIKAGFRGSALKTAVMVSFAENGSHEPTLFSKPNTDGSIDRGLWQINDKAHPNYSDADMRKGQENANAAYKISSKGRNWKPWTTYNNGAYQRYEKQAERAISAAQKLNSAAASSGGGGPATVGTGSGGNAPRRTNSRLASDFMNEVLSQRGKPYIFGADSSPSNKNPRGFDCSSLIDWGAARVGCENLPRIANVQYEYCVKKGTNISVERAIHIRGAILFKAGSDPAGRYGIGHVAISMGNGRDTFEAYSTGYSINTYHHAKSFKYGALIPGMKY